MKNHLLHNNSDVQDPNRMNLQNEQFCAFLNLMRSVHETLIEAILNESLTIIISLVIFKFISIICENWLICSSRNYSLKFKILYFKRQKKINATRLELSCYRLLLFVIEEDCGLSSDTKSESSLRKHLNRLLDKGSDDLSGICKWINF